MKFDDITLILEKRKYTHRKDYAGNKKGSYIEKGKTKWDYSEGGRPGNERIVTQIQNKLKNNYGITSAYGLARMRIKLKLEEKETQKLYDHLAASADKRFEHEGPQWRGYVYGGLAKIIASKIAADLEKKERK